MPRSRPANRSAGRPPSRRIPRRLMSPANHSADSRLSRTRSRTARGTSKNLLARRGCIDAARRTRLGMHSSGERNGPPAAPRCGTGDSHISLQHRPGLTELATAVDCVELFHAAPHGGGTRGLIVAVPSSQPGDDPGCRGEAGKLMRIALALGVAFEIWAEDSKGFDFLCAEHVGCWQTGLAVTLSGELNVDARCFSCSGCEFDQAIRAGNLAVFQLQTVRF